MPTLPACPPDVPEILNPLNPRHYWLLFTWIYFRPSRLKHYLYRTDPELYRATGRAFFTTLRLPGYRNLYVMSLILTVALSVSVAWAASAAQDTPTRWFGVVLGVAGGVGYIVALGVALGVAVGVAFGVVFGARLGVAFGVAVGVAFGVAGGVAYVVAIGVAFGVVFGVAGGVALGVVFGVVFGVAFGVAGGVAFSVALGVAGGVAFGAGGSRLVFYLLEWPLAWWLSRSTENPMAHLKRHPAVWDEMAVWPLPGTDRLLKACLSAGLDRSLELAAQIAANPFQRWAVQRALSDFPSGHDDPLAVLYHLAQTPALDDYVTVPAARREFRDFPSARLVLLGEVGQGFVDGTGGYSETSERWVWRLTRRWRRITPTPLSRFGEMLYVLCDAEESLATIEIEKVAKTIRQLGPNFEGVRAFPHGPEVADSFAAILASLEVQDLSGLADRTGLTPSPEPFLRPWVMEALKALGDVSEDVAACGRATSAGWKSAALNRAAGALNELAGYVEKEVLPPERILLKRVVEHWQSIVAEAQGKLGEAALREMTPAMRHANGIVDRVSTLWQRPVKPLDNPYVVGNPVSPPLFTGRTGVFNRIGEVWSAKAVPDSIIVYGHRRMGKSSILRNLDQAAPPGSVIAYVDMQGETAFVESTADLLLGVADRIHAAVRRTHPDADLPQPDPALFSTSATAQREFNRFTDHVREVLKGHTLILAVDEFEAVERAVEAAKIGREIYQFVRSKTQEPWITLVLGGLHTLDEMSRDYEQPFYGSYENIRVSYLSHDDAWHLIANPTPDFNLNYEPEAVERIIAETGGQPYLIQQICRDALDHLNHELFDERSERDVLITLADVEAVLGPDFFQRGTVYFDGVWTQASAPEYRTLLRIMAQRDEPWAFAELETATQLSSNALRAALRWAERHDILHKSESEPAVWKFYVPLMRRWVDERAPL